MIKKIDDFTKLKLKLIAFLIFLVFIIISILSYSIYLSYREQRITEIENRLKEQIPEITGLLDIYGLQIKSLFLTNIPEGTFICVHSQEKKLCVYDKDGIVSFYKKSQPEGYILISTQYKDYKIDLGVGENTIENELKKLKLSIILSDIMVIILSGFLGYLVFGRLLKPIKESEDKLKQIIQIVSHDIRTPISVINTNLYLIKKKGECKSKNLDNIEKNVEYIKTLIKNLNYISAKKPTIKEEVDINTLVKELLEKFETSIKLKNITIDLTENSNLKVFANKDDMKVVLSNLIDNAIKYNYQNGEVHIEINENCFIIKNTGNPIKDKKKIFDIYYREDESGTTEGMGIGLAIVKKLCQAYNLRLNVETNNEFNTFSICK
ncbi:MAG: HAMP domain-containing sensor histidine kinase [Hydrogenothermaceae bacterium]